MDHQEYKKTTLSPRGERKRSGSQSPSSDSEESNKEWPHSLSSGVRSSLKNYPVERPLNDPNYPLLKGTPISSEAASDNDLTMYQTQDGQKLAYGGGRYYDGDILEKTGKQEQADLGKYTGEKRADAYYHGQRQTNVVHTDISDLLPLIKEEQDKPTTQYTVKLKARLQQAKESGESLETIRKSFEEDTMLKPNERRELLKHLEGVSDLVEGIQKSAVIDPVQLAPNGTIVQGNHRVLASLYTGKTKIPVQAPAPLRQATAVQTTEPIESNQSPRGQAPTLNGTIGTIAGELGLKRTIGAHILAAREKFKDQVVTPQLEMEIKAFLQTYKK